MKIYTYCSFKASSTGYQYASVDTKKVDNHSGQDSIRSCLKEWFENKSGWKIVLKKGKNASDNIAYLLISSLESVNRSRNQRTRDRILELEEANKFRKNKKSLDSSELQLLDSQVYVNLALEGDLNTLFCITIGVLLELYNDEGWDLYNKIASEITDVKNEGHYLVNGKGLNLIFNDLKKKGEESLSKSENNSRNESIWKRICNRNKPVPYIRKMKNDRNDNMISLINELPRPQDFSLSKMIYIAEEDCDLEKYGTFNVSISYDFLKREK